MASIKSRERILANSDFWILQYSSLSLPRVVRIPGSRVKRESGSGIRCTSDSNCPSRGLICFSSVRAGADPDKKVSSALSKFFHDTSVDLAFFLFDTIDEILLAPAAALLPVELGVSKGRTALE
jgi:hypothetical protein